MKAQPNANIIVSVCGATEAGGGGQEEQKEEGQEEEEQEQSKRRRRRSETFSKRARKGDKLAELSRAAL